MKQDWQDTFVGIACAVVFAVWLGLIIVGVVQ